MTLVSAEQLKRAAPLAKLNIVDAIVCHVDDVFSKYGLLNLNRVWGFFSVAVEETGGLRTLTENLNYTALRAHQVFPWLFPTIEAAIPYAHHPEAFADRVYGGRMGNVNPVDGWRYRGQGLIQITGYDNFAMLERLTNLPLLNSPDLVTSDAYMLECATALFVRYPGILEYCDEAQWHAVWALVGSGRATGHIVNLPNHEQALAYVQAAITALGPAQPGQSAPAAPEAPPPCPPAAAPSTPAGQPSADNSLWAIAAILDKLVTRLENAIARIPHAH
jgi:predicted chitinase